MRARIFKLKPGVRNTPGAVDPVDYAFDREAVTPDSPEPEVWASAFGLLLGDIVYAGDVYYKLDQEGLERLDPGAATSYLYRLIPDVQSGRS